MRLTKIDLVIISLLLLTWQQTCAQQVEKITLNGNPATGYYLLVKPADNKIKGVLVLLPGFGSTAESVFAESKLPQLATAKQLLVVALAAGNKVYADKTVIAKLNACFLDVMKRNTIKKNQFVIGGFSAGGTIALRYAELCNKETEKYPIQPQAVFAIDSPVDLLGLYDEFINTIEQNTSAMATEEAKFVSGLMKEEIGTPQTNKDNYLNLTPFYQKQKGQGNEQYLKDIPVRVYHDMDINWQLKNRQKSMYNMNALNSSELILRLILLGNTSAEFINGKTGYRSDGSRHPHAWSIVDESNHIDWVLNALSR